VKKNTELEPRKIKVKYFVGIREALCRRVL